MLQLQALPYCPITPSKSWVLIMRNRALSLCALALLGVTAPVIIAPPAFACGGEKVHIPPAPTGKVVFYNATHPSFRCLWRWGDTDTQFAATKLIPLAGARALFNRLREEARNKRYFEDHGTWFVYYDELSDWKAVGYYGVGQQPFSKP
jgi:hypothetical protein